MHSHHILSLLSSILTLTHPHPTSLVQKIQRFGQSCRSCACPRLVSRGRQDVVKEPDPLQGEDNVVELHLQPERLGVQVFLLVHKRDQTLIVQRRARVLKLVECETRDLAGPAKVNVLRVERCQGDLSLSHQCGGAKDHLLVLRQGAHPIDQRELEAPAQGKRHVLEVNEPPPRRATVDPLPILLPALRDMALQGGHGGVQAPAHISRGRRNLAAAQLQGPRVEDWPGQRPQPVLHQLLELGVEVRPKVDHRRLHPDAVEVWEHPEREVNGVGDAHKDDAGALHLREGEQVIQDVSLAPVQVVHLVQDKNDHVSGAVRLALSGPGPAGCGLPEVGQRKGHVPLVGLPGALHAKPLLQEQGKDPPGISKRHAVDLDDLAPPPAALVTENLAKGRGDRPADDVGLSRSGDPGNVQ
mmetsp:Transcript_10501/g.37306  ORF Transcript_10501/g.37306 Transcript_10501/m.37306 type:complete len:413 (-) Transcript_10501:18-1256(-)